MNKCNTTNIFSIFLIFSCCLDIRRMKVKLGPKPYHFSYFTSSSTIRIPIFSNFFFPWNVANQHLYKSVPAIFFNLNIFLNSMPSFVSMQNLLKHWKKWIINCSKTVRRATLLCSSLLEMCKKNLKLIIQASFALENVKCSSIRNLSPAKVLWPKILISRLYTFSDQTNICQFFYFFFESIFHPWFHFTIAIK